MGHIDDVPAAVTDAGQERNYTDPPPVAALVLVAAPVDSTLRVVGVNRAAYDTHISSEVAAGRSWSGDIVMYDPRRPLKLPLTYAQASAYNYARLTFQGRVWYLFVDSIEYAAMGTTILNTTVDPVPTYPGWSLGHSTVERSHAAVAASQGDTYGDRYCTAPEPFSAPPALGVLSADILNTTTDDWTILVVSVNDLKVTGSLSPFFERHSAEAFIRDAPRTAWLAGRGPIVGGDDYQPTGGGDHGVISDYDSPHPWHVDSSNDYYVPIVRAARPSSIDGVAQGGGVYKFTLRGYLRWLSIMQGASWIMEGITDYRLVPSWAVSGGGDSTTPPALMPPTSPTSSDWAEAAGIPVYVSAVTTGSYDTTVLSGWRDTYLNSVGGQWYRKLITGAHTKLVVSDGVTATQYEPEFMRSSGVNLHARTGAAHGENTVRVTADYNELTDQLAVDMATGGAPGSAASGYGRAAANTAAADLGLANSAYNSYLTREAMEYNRMLAIHMGESKVPMNLGIIGVQSVMQAGGGAVLGSAGGPLGAIAGAVAGGASALVTGALSANNSLDLLDVSSNGSIDIGSYQLSANGKFNAISFRSWVQALRSVSGKGAAGGLTSAWRFVTGKGLEAVVVAPTADHVQTALSTWRRYGYMVGRAFEPSRLDVMSRYSYWKTQDATILGNIPQADRERIANAFNSGVTVYNSLGDIGRDVSAANAPVAGFTY